MTKASEWATRVTAWRASGKTAKDFCLGKDYAAERLLWWSSDLTRRGMLQSPENPVALTRVVRRQETQPAAVVVHVGSVRVEIQAGADKTTVCTVMDVLTARSDVGGSR